MTFKGSPDRFSRAGLLSKVKSGLGALCLSSSLLLSSGVQAETPYNTVNPFIGTANEGNTFPGAARPFGMIQWSPDTSNGWYHYSEKRIHGFSLTHLSGVGCPIFADMPILPWGEQPSADRSKTPLESIGFEHKDEIAHPGFYSVKLADGTSVELTVTDRSGLMRVRFAPGKHAGLLLNAGGSADADVHMAKLPPVGRGHDGESLTAEPDGSVTGQVTSGGFCGSDTRYTLHIALQPQKAPRKVMLWQDGHQSEGKHAEGKHAVAWLDLGEDSEQLVKIGLSFVSEAKAKANLHRELPGWDFDAVHHQAEAAWTKALGAVELGESPTQERTIFYTALYHDLLAPTLFSDVDGQYEGFDWQPHHVAPGQQSQYANFSDWDTYRNTAQLHAWLEPQRAGDMAQSLVNDAEQMGSLPRWAVANDSSYVMGGDSPSILLAEFYAFGGKRFNTRAALHYMVQGATKPGIGAHSVDQRVHLAPYLKLGYIPFGIKSAAWDISASETLEDVNADFAIGQFAAATGSHQVAAEMVKRAGNWHNLLDPETRWIRPRNQDGSWLAGFDAEKSLPRAGDTPVPTDQLGFQEGNTYQYTFMIPFDYAGLFKAIGEDSVVEQRLDKFFSKLVCWGEPCFNMANEPDFVTPYAYTFLGKPAKTAAVVTRIESETFKNSPSGLAGNDDLGATSGVYLWNALGMYPAIPGTAGVVLGIPLFAKATLHLGGGETLTIDRRGSGPYVQSVQLNGANYPSSWLPLSALRPGRNNLKFVVGADTNSTWATAPANRPPSASIP